MPFRGIWSLNLGIIWEKAGPNTALAGVRARCVVDQGRKLRPVAGGTYQAGLPVVVKVADRGQADSPTPER
jgi:hypothetical protein